ncbi:MAG: cell division protein ZapA [Cellvibrionales bacterium TMED148]|nr:cell division protein ZapA [Porticoccaceae bacterium]RPG88679.1 MAG: cell division protein ZapA [Cellvibrionales bacterium TMED148]
MPEEQDALQASAALLSNKMEEIRSVSNIIGIERIAVMAALNLTHDLLRSEDAAKRDAAASKLLQAADDKLDSVLFELDSR